MHVSSIYQSRILVIIDEEIALEELDADDVRALDGLSNTYRTFKIQLQVNLSL